jgi:diadenosine tetraphosphatase ApaH/serine/threonine PP2A family protein phosphatase
VGLKYAIISDLHANLEALKAVLARIDACGVDKTVCLGDVVGYNANPNECVALVRERRIPTVCGNHDAVACGLDEPWGFNPVAYKAVEWTRESLTEDSRNWLRQLPDTILVDDFLAVHGSPNDRDSYLFTWDDIEPHLEHLEEQHRRLCFFGHTHSPGVFSSDGLYAVDGEEAFKLNGKSRTFVNPGSVGQPRDGNPMAAFGLLDTEEGGFRLIRVPYPIENTAQSIMDAKLPYFLAERLFLGR